jgi:hypothetical protein
MRTLLLTVFAVSILLLSSLYSFAESTLPKYAIGLGLEVSSGTFGTGSTSTFATAPVIIDWFPTDRIYLELTVPFLYQNSKNTGHAVLGTNVQSTAKSVARGPMSGGSGNGSGGGMMGGTGGGMFGGDYGLGDITLTSGYTLLVDSETSLNLRPTLYVKFPTADESKGLGTGEYDFGAGVAVSKWLGNWQPFTEARYILQAAPHDETGAKNFITADAGVAYSWSERFVTSAFTRFGSALFDGMSAPLEARAKMVWRFGERTYADVYALKGFSDGSPDYGGGTAVFVEF